jgi:hypothetical protein
MPGVGCGVPPFSPVWQISASASELERPSTTSSIQLHALAMARSSASRLWLTRADDGECMTPLACGDFDIAPPSGSDQYIGHAISSGCIRMTNEDAIDLYNRVRIGTLRRT